MDNNQGTDPSYIERVVRVFWDWTIDLNAEQLAVVVLSDGTQQIIPLH